MSELELDILRTRMSRLITLLVIVALMMGGLALASTVVAFRSIASADSSRVRQTTRITELEQRIVELENRGLPPK